MECGRFSKKEFEKKSKIFFCKNIDFFNVVFILYLFGYKADIIKRGLTMRKIIRLLVAVSASFSNGLFANQDFLDLFEGAPKFYQLSETEYLSEEVLNLYKIKRQENGAIGSVEIARLTREKLYAFVQIIGFYPNGQLIRSLFWGLFNIFVSKNPILDNPKRWHERKINLWGQVILDQYTKEKNGKKYTFVSRLDPQTGVVESGKVIDPESKKIIAIYDGKADPRPVEPFEEEEQEKASIVELYLEPTTEKTRGLQLLDAVAAFYHMAGKEVFFLKKTKETLLLAVKNPVTQKVEHLFTYFENGNYCFKKEKI